MIPAGFLACRGELTFGIPYLDLGIVVFLGLCGSIAGAFFNYYFALLLGRPFLHKYGKYFFVKKEVLERAEELFRDYGEITTFVCRLIPAIRQLISLPAGISRMSVPRFAFFYWSWCWNMGIDIGFSWILFWFIIKKYVICRYGCKRKRYDHA